MLIRMNGVGQDRVWINVVGDTSVLVVDVGPTGLMPCLTAHSARHQLAGHRPARFSALRGAG